MATVEIPVTNPHLAAEMTVNAEETAKTEITGTAAETAETTRKTEKGTGSPDRTFSFFCW